MLDERAPVRWVLEAGRVRGTLVAERDDASVAAEVRRAFLTQAALVVVVLLALYAALIPVFRRVTAELEARNRRLAESEARYRTLMEQGTFFVADISAKILSDGRFLTSIRDATERQLLREAV